MKRKNRSPMPNYETGELETLQSNSLALDYTNSPPVACVMRG